jgi:uncharacterized membrane protein
MTLVDFKAFYGKHGLKLWFGAIIGVIALLTLGCLLAPEIFWDKFIYRYYWGPLEVDAHELGSIEQSDGYVIDQGYTLVSELTYGIVLIIALYGIFRLFERLDVKIDMRFAASVLPYIFLGGALRVMEDAELFSAPYVYFMISPVIYFVIGTLIVIMAASSQVVDGKSNYSSMEKLILGARPFFVFNAVYILVYLLHADKFNFIVHPYVPIVLSIFVLFIMFLRYRKTEEYDGYLSMFMFGVFLLGFSAFVLSLWPDITAWTSAYLEAHGGDIDTQPEAVPIVLSISVGITLCVYALGRKLGRKHEAAGIFALPLNVLIIFGQMLDAAATFVGVDIFGYAEKHPVPDFFFVTFGTSAIFIPIKLGLACAIVYLMDISFKEELKTYPVLKGLIKLIVIILGLAPGTRDMLRAAMGI